MPPESEHKANLIAESLCVTKTYISRVVWRISEKIKDKGQCGEKCPESQVPWVLSLVLILIKLNGLGNPILPMYFM